MLHTFYDPLNERFRVEIQEASYVIEYFRANELGCQCCGKIRLARGFAEELVVLRSTYGNPMVITSACRCDKHNLDVGGHPNSAHLCSKMTKHTESVDYGACGVDVANPTDKLISTAMALGWSVGIAQNFAHLDRIADYSQSKTYQRLFYYEGVSLGPQEHWNEQYPLIQAARGTLAAMSWES